MEKLRKSLPENPGRGGLISKKSFFTLLFRTFRPLKVGMTPLGQKYELRMQVLDDLTIAEQKTMGLASPLGSINGF